MEVVVVVVEKREDGCEIRIDSAIGVSVRPLIGELVIFLSVTNE